MIRLVRGRMIARGKDYLIIDMGGEKAGIGVKVYVPEPTLAKYQADEATSLHTYLQVRELQIFELLLGVSGVGPKVALATLSTLAPDTLRLALANDEPAIIARVPGIGKRTAQKIVVDLKDKVSVPTAQLASLAATVDDDSEVLEALTALGYSVVEAQRAIQNIPSEVVGVENRLRMALGQFDS